MDILRSYLDGESPLPPVARLTGRGLVSVDKGAATFELLKSDWLASGKGRLHAGVLAFLADASLTGAVQSALPARTLCTTATYTALDLRVNFLRPVSADGGALTATGTVLHRGRQLVISPTGVTHAGKTVAIATGTTALST